SKENRLAHMAGGETPSEPTEAIENNEEKDGNVPEDADSAVSQIQAKGDKMGRHFDMPPVTITPRAAEQIAHQEAIADKVGLKVEPGSVAHEVLNADETIAQIYDDIGDLPKELSDIVRREMASVDTDKLDSDALQAFADQVTAIVDAYVESEGDRRDVSKARRSIANLHISEGQRLAQAKIDDLLGGVMKNEAVASVFNSNKEEGDADESGTAIASVD
ncbi:hypothetical protein KAR91_64635, partial [Candidatus Pacearchaeota archaeon]|nr:hypothetical protein [Candidatus Pacearchaeota archaeon]